MPRVPLPIRLSAIARYNPRPSRGARMVVWGLSAALALFALAAPSAAQFPIPQFERMRPGIGGFPGTQAPGNIVSRNASSSAPLSTSTAPHPAVARIMVKERDALSYGSGSLVDVQGEFGLIVTNWHVVRDAAGEIKVQFPSGFQSPAQIVKTDADWDLAALSIRRPKDVLPLAIPVTAPRPGDSLAIAGYGSGDYRAVAGRCTQYLAPGENFPYEMLEVSAEARQGDSGGPIFNERGELAGVLFGAGRGFTSGSFAGRVQQFLTSVLPAAGGTSNRTAIAVAPQNSPPPLSPPAITQFSSPPVVPPLPLQTAQHQPQPQNTALHEEAPRKNRGFDAVELAPVEVPPVEFARETAVGYDDAHVADSGDVPEERVASKPAARDISLAPAAEATFDQPHMGTIHTSLPPRGGSHGGPDLNNAPPDELLAAAWKKLGGSTFFDQAKTVLAIVGILSLLVQFWRLNSQPEPVGEEE